MPPWIRAFAQPTTYLGAVMIALVWTGVYFLANTAHERAAADGLRKGLNLSRVFEEYVSRVIKGTDSALLVFRKLYAQDPDKFDFNDWADSATARNNLTVHFSITGPDGFIRQSTLGGIADTINIRDREPFRVHINSSTDELYISAPTIGLLSGKLSIQLTRKLFAPDGSFGGVIGASLDIRQLEQFYNSVNIGPGSVIALVGTDGIIRARSGRDSTAGHYVGQSVAERQLFTLLQRDPAGAYWNSISDLKFDRIRRLICYRVLEGLPLIAVIGLAEDDIFAESQLTARKYNQIGLFLTAIALFAIGIGLRREFKLVATASALERSKQSLERTNVLFSTALRNMAHGLTMFDSNQRLVVCNERYGEMYGLAPELTRAGTALRTILASRACAACTAQDAERYVEEHLQRVCGSQAFYAVDELPDGRIFAISHQPMRDGGWVAIHQDVTAEKRAEARIAYLASHDALTELSNRAVLRERMEESLARLHRGGKAFTLFMLDLDIFKSVNDSLGHPVGDELLKMVARRLVACLRESDTVARLGGDEFAILAAADADQRAAAITTADQLLEAVSAPYLFDGHQLDISTSVGIALAPEHGTDVDQLIKSGDLALYRAKLGGRNAYRVFEAAMGVNADARRSLEIDLRNGLTREEFELHYQPIVDMRTNQIVNFESLIRWRHPERGSISPGDFIPVAEESGLINPIGEWVLRQACADAALWPARIKVAVNVSAVQFRRGNLVEMIASVLAASGLTAERLILEITESVLMQGTKENVETLHRLRGLGISIVLDDFGTGYSSLSYLRVFPFDQIKIDRSFVGELSSSADCAAIVSAVASLGRDLCVDTVAEGIETEDQLLLARASGCTHAQGYLLGRPCPAAELDLTGVTARQSKGEAA
jgi:diguanylate cyclase (GGDEF)-like protein